MKNLLEDVHIGTPFNSHNVIRESAVFRKILQAEPIGESFVTAARIHIKRKIMYEKPQK